MDLDHWKYFFFLFYRVFCNKFALVVDFSFMFPLWETLFAEKGFIYEKEFYYFLKGFVIT